MTTPKDVVQKNSTVNFAEVAISLGLFLLAFLPRAYDLQRFVTADEAKWVYRSAQFLAALLQGDLPATTVNLTPAVTTTWLGSLGLSLYYWLNRSIINIPFTEWLLSLPQFRTEIPILAATRWPMVIFTSLGVVVIYWLTRHLFNRTTAIIAAVFMALSPHTVALSRVLGHDAPVAVFMTISLLLLLLAANSRVTSTAMLMVLSGVAAGLAFLSKAPALFLIPFAGLVCVWQIWTDRTSFGFWFKQFLLWLAIAYLTFVIVWPAAWVNPAGQPWVVVENAFLSATDQEESDSENFWLVPNLGPFYYLVHGSFKLSPLVTLGLLLAIFFILKKQNSPPFSSHIAWLLAYIALFTIFMTLGGKRSPRYILPIFPPLAVIAAFGWYKLYQAASSKWQAVNNKNTPRTTRHLSLITHHSSFIILITLTALILLYPYAPYYFTYFNPLLGGSYTAPNLVKMGWGEGLDQVGRFLQRERPGSRVGTAYASTVAPFFKGDLSSPTGDRLDYVVLYTKQVQSGEPAPAIIRYYEEQGPVFTAKLNGISYARVFPGPAVQPALTAELVPSALPKPIGYRPLTPYGRIGEQLEIDVLWEADELPASPVTLTLEPNAEQAELSGPVEIEAPGTLTRQGDELVVSRHNFTLPDDLERGRYNLLITPGSQTGVWEPGEGSDIIGEIELRRFQTPAKMGSAPDAIFDNQIAISGYQINPTEDYIGVTVAWQALTPHLPDYTVFVQLLEAETNERVAGIDTQPVKGQWPTSRWVEGEVVVDEYLVAIPYEMPPGYYKVIVGLYQPETGQRLTLFDGQDSWALPWLFIRKQETL